MAANAYLELLHVGHGVDSSSSFLVELLLDNQWVADTSVELK